jgi:DNA-binding ferritin-like protein
MKKATSKNSKTQRKRASRRKTQKKLSGVSSECKDKIVRIFIEMINAVKIYHWKTRSFSQHKATDELYGKMNDHVDKFVETMLGKDESRIKLLSKHTELYDFSNTFSFKERIYEYREFLISMSDCLKDSRDTDLLNIRDEILGDINQFLYLLTFNK